MNAREPGRRVDHARDAVTRRRAPFVSRHDVVTRFATEAIARSARHMNDRASAHASPHDATWERPHRPPPIELWRLRGETDDLRVLAIETSYGYAIGIELDTELLMMHLQPSLEKLVALAARIETALIAMGWHVITAPGGWSDLR
jgi:hypothetical protein